MKSLNIDSAYIASGFFADFTTRLQNSAPDFGINEDMEDKQLFLLGGYENNPLQISALRDAFLKHGLKAHAMKLPPLQKGDVPLRWHAKVAVFLSDEKPVLAIVGSSNFTGPTMYGGSEQNFIASPELVQVEADSFYWLNSHLDAAQAVHDAFHYWGNGIDAPHIAFNDEKFDHEIEKLLNSIYSDLQSFPWQPLED